MFCTTLIYCKRKEDSQKASLFVNFYISYQILSQIEKTILLKLIAFIRNAKHEYSRRVQIFCIQIKDIQLLMMLIIGILFVSFSYLRFGIRIKTSVMIQETDIFLKHFLLR